MLISVVAAATTTTARISKFTRLQKNCYENVATIFWAKSVEEERNEK